MFSAWQIDELPELPFSYRARGQRITQASDGPGDLRRQPQQVQYLSDPRSRDALFPSQIGLGGVPPAVKDFSPFQGKCDRVAICLPWPGLRNPHHVQAAPELCSESSTFVTARGANCIRGRTSRSLRCFGGFDFSARRWSLHTERARTVNRSYKLGIYRFVGVAGGGGMHSDSGG